MKRLDFMKLLACFTMESRVNHLIRYDLLAIFMNIALAGLQKMIVLNRIEDEYKLCGTDLLSLLMSF